jgi:hypothetical protein
MAEKKKPLAAQMEKSREKLRFDKLAAYKGPKVGRWLRHSVKQHIHDLFEELTILRLLDPRVEEDLRRFKMLEPLELYTRAREIGREG